MTDSGLIPRDYDREPEGVAAKEYEGDLLQMRDWPDAIMEQHRNSTSAWHVHKFNRVPILNQARYKYCWAYAVVAGVMNRYAFQGINDPVDELSANAIAAQGKGYRNVGGHCSQAVSYAIKYGIPLAKYWPNTSINRTYADDTDVKSSAEQTNIIDFIDCGRNFEAAATCLIKYNMPVAFALPWWRHAVLGLRLWCKNPRRPLSIGSYRLDFVNSYGPKYGQKGYGSVVGDKIIGQEHIAISSVKVKSDDKR
jgi:hypothetical protein